LRIVGARRYLRHPSTRLLSAAFKYPGSSCIWIWIPSGRAPRNLLASKCVPEGAESVVLCEQPEPPDLVQRWIRGGRTFVAHNASNFDAAAWELLVGGPQPNWFDTIHTARASGYPGSLDALGGLLLGRGKDKGKDACKLLWTAKERNGGYSYTVGTAALWHEALRYNAADVVLLEAVYNATHTAVEPDVLDFHTRVNERGCPIDAKLAAELLELWRENAARAAARVGEETQGELTAEDLWSPVKVKRWLADRGVILPSLNKKQLEAFYETPEEFADLPEHVERAIHVLRDRASSVRATAAKVKKLLNTADEDGRIRDWAVYYGAHTGRFSGRGMQPHNMASGVAADVPALLSEPLSYPRVECEAAIVEIETNKRTTPDDVLATLFRPLIHAAPGKTLLKLDYAGIEARMIAWLAREERMISLFRDPKQDPYCDMAGVIFGRAVTKKDVPERQVGKVVVLGAGFGMSARKFGMTCELNGIDLAASGTSAEACISAYRKANSKIVGLWRAYGDAAMMVASNKVDYTYAGRCRFARERDAMTIELPSGRKLFYRACRVEDCVPGYCKFLGLPEKPRPTVTYASRHGRSGLYGGLLAENVTQAASSDLFRDAAVKLDARFPVVLHVHDELVFEVDAPAAQAALAECALVMSTPPLWANDFPLRVDGSAWEHYSKILPKSAPKADAMNGVML
jgi:DNA polymerase bacteriophage-type